MMNNAKEFRLWPPELDAVVAASESHKILLENDRVRVLEVIIQPGRKEPMHQHRWFSVMVVDSPADIRYHHVNGNVEDIQRKESGAVTLTESLPPEKLHAVENIDTKIYHAFRIELKE